ncbi:hypothetical protein [Prosthecobacter sp.]|uniref:hypothetical protein n=1 Tax=Prosthecobacter sp. TaxID=1965333 RepID=UPI00378496A8
MKFDFESLSSEPLVYMLMHSGAFVCVLGFIFFVVGMLFGYATWGRYKHQTRELRGEADAMKEEIAVLKRKIGDHSIKSGAAVAMATETIHMPKKDGAHSAEQAPAVTEETITTQEVVQPVVPAPDPPTRDELPKVPANIIKVRTASPAGKPLEIIPKPEDKENDAETATVSEALEAMEAQEAPEAPEAPAPPPGPLAEEPAAFPAETQPEPASHGSPLAAIIASPPHKGGPEEEAPVAETPATPDSATTPAASEVLPTVIELSVPPLPALDFHPELDPKLGLIYKGRPEQIDDLTELKGISQDLQQRLHDIGIYTFTQIAAWNEDHIKEFSARLAFKDRIQREHWVEQAAQLAAKPVAA